MRFTVAVASFLIVALPSPAQPPAVPIPSPKLLTVFPMGIKAGSSVELAVSGTDIADATAVVTSHPGLTGKVVNEKGKPPKIVLSCKPEVMLGLYDIRLVTPLGITNPRFVEVERLTEVNEIEPNNDVPQAQRIELENIVNGTIGNPTDVDYVTFAGKAGQSIIIHAATGSIDSKARPLLELFDPAGKRLVQNRNHDGTDALVKCVLPATGDYIVRLCEFAYQTGSAEHWYRLTVRDEAKINRDDEIRFLRGGVVLNRRRRIDPVRAFDTFLDQAFRAVDESEPMNDRPETATLLWDDQKITNQISVDGRIGHANDRDWYRLKVKKGEPIVVTLEGERIGSAVDLVMSIRDAKSNKEIAGENQLDDDTESLHPIGFPSRSLDPPSFRYDPPAEGELRICVAARAASTQANYTLRITPPRPRVWAVAMPRSREQPSGVTVRPGNETAMDVYVHRVDGFAGPVTVAPKKLQAGWLAKPAVIGTNQKWGTLFLFHAPGPNRLVAFSKWSAIVRPVVPELFTELTFDARFDLDGKTESRPVATATIVHALPQNSNNPAITRLDQSLPVAVRNRPILPSFSLMADLAKAVGKDGKPLAGPLKLKPGERAVVPIRASWAGGERPAINLTMEPTHSDNAKSPFSGNNANTQVTIAKDKSEASVTLDIRPNALPGTYRATIRGDGPVTATVVPGKKQAMTVSAWATIDVTVIAK